MCTFVNQAMYNQPFPSTSATSCPINEKKQIIIMPTGTPKTTTPENHA